jgi:hypothetical protein
MVKKILIAIIIVVVALAIPFAIYTISPLFVSNTVNEPLPPSITTNQIVDKNSSLQEYKKFNSMNEQDRLNSAKQMSQNQINVIMIGAAQINNTINENMNLSVVPTIIRQQNNLQQQQQNKLSENTTTTSTIITGSFIGAGDGFHNTEGLVKIIPLEDGDGRSILRLENFLSTNGPNVHIYLADDKTASDFIDLGRLKANNGNQNYDIPFGTNLTKYNMALIWCKDFSVLFGSAQLRA